MAKAFLHPLKIGFKLSSDLFLPRFCAGCGIRLNLNDDYVCHQCLKDLICIKKHIGCEWELEKIFFNKVYSPFLYDGTIRNLVHLLKYNGYSKITGFMVQLMSDYLNRNVKGQIYDGLIPIPLHPVKKRERGYNQALLLANDLSKILGIPVTDNLLFRKRYTETQTLKSHEERVSNLDNAFIIKDKIDLKHKKYLLVDDVITTGSTVNQAAKLLKMQGADRTDVLTFAYANI